MLAFRFYFDIQVYFQLRKRFPKPRLFNSFKATFKMKPFHNKRLFYLFSLNSKVFIQSIYCIQDTLLEGLQFCRITVLTF